MPVRINNFESNVNVVGDRPSGGLSETEVEKIVQIVMERIQMEQDLLNRINEETKITNKVSKQDLFD